MTYLALSENWCFEGGKTYLEKITQIICKLFDFERYNDK